MSEETKIDENYKEAFNLGYELSKELNLKSPMFKDSKVDNERMNAMQAGMAQFSNEINPGKDKNKGLGLTI
jgi:hypothetical protein